MNPIEKEITEVVTVETVTETTLAHSEEIEKEFKVSIPEVPVVKELEVEEEFVSLEARNLLESAEISYIVAEISALSLTVVKLDDLEEKKARLGKRKSKKVDLRKGSTVSIGEISYETSSRFYKSLRTATGIVDGVFNIFTPKEVIERLAELHKGENFRFCIQGNTLVGMGPEKKTFMHFDNVKKWLYNIGATDISFGMGTVTGYINDDKPFEIEGSDKKFLARTGFRIPFDGISNAQQFAALKHESGHGIVGHTSALAIGHNISHAKPFMTLNKAVENISVGESHEAITNQIKLMMKSGFSIAEAKSVSSAFRKGGYNSEAESFERKVNLYRFGPGAVAAKNSKSVICPCVYSNGVTDVVISAFEVLEFLSNTLDILESKSIEASYGATDSLDLIRNVMSELVTKKLDLEDFIAETNVFSEIFDVA